MSLVYLKKPFLTVDGYFCLCVMQGCLGPNVTMTKLIQVFKKKYPTGSPFGMAEDQDFLTDQVWPRVKNNAVEYDSQAGRTYGAKAQKSFPEMFVKWHNDFFVGQPTGKYGPVGLPQCQWNCSLKFGKPVPGKYKDTDVIHIDPASLKH